MGGRRPVRPDEPVREGVVWGWSPVALVRERDRRRVLRMISRDRDPHQRLFVGKIAPIDLYIETPEKARDRVPQAAEYLPLENHGTTDDCGFAPFSDDTSTSRDTVFAKIRARVVGTTMTAEALGAG